MSEHPRSAAADRGGIPDPAELLGTTRSGLDRDEVELHPDFQQLQRSIDDLLGAFVRGELDSRDVAQRLADARVVDDQGLEWTMGATTRAWYCRVPGGTWAEALPPLIYVGQRDGVADPLADDAAAGAPAPGLTAEQLQQPPDGSAPGTVPPSPPLR